MTAFSNPFNLSLATNHSSYLPFKCQWWCHQKLTLSRAELYRNKSLNSFAILNRRGNRRRWLAFHPINKVSWNTSAHMTRILVSKLRRKVHPKTSNNSRCWLRSRSRTYNRQQRISKAAIMTSWTSNLTKSARISINKSSKWVTLSCHPTQTPE